MFSPADFPRTLIAIAVSAAVTASARAQEASPASEGTVVATQTYFPTAGSIDNERINSAAVIGRINADYAYSRGITGKGVTIAIMDTGIAASHREFAESGKLAQGFNAITGGTNVNDTFGHGTHVAGLLGADRDGRGIFGVAYDAQLLPIKVLTDAGSGSTDILDRGLRYAIGKAAIANMSLGTSTSYNPGALRDAVRSGLLIVAAAGNDGAANPGWPARFAKEVWANNQIIAVGAVDSANRIASFSNRAGDAAAWYLVAPGVHIASTYLNGQYAYASGTSMATPVVSGAAALIKQMWPALRADQIANILFVIVAASMFGSIGLLPYYLQDVLHLDVLYIGGILLPGGLLMGLLGPVVGRLYDKVGPKPLLIPGIILVSAVLWSATLLSPSTPWQAVLVVYTIMCVGFALLFGPLFTLSLGSIEPRFYSHGSAILGSIQQVAGAAGVALLISVMSATQAANLAGGADAAAALSAGIRASFLIAAIGCLEGFKVSGSAESVGAHTTSSVVQSIFVVIVLDAVAALFFMEMGW